MHAFFRHPKVRRARIIFRWCRIFVWMVILVMMTIISYLHLIGLPDFVKKPLLRRLTAEGIKAEFSNMQLGWSRGPAVIVENATFSRANQTYSPRLSTRLAELDLDWEAFYHRRIDAGALIISGGNLLFPIPETNGNTLLLDNVGLHVRFASNDVVIINNCVGTFHGIQIDIIGRVTHANEIRDWKFLSPHGGTNGMFLARLRDIAHIVQRVHFRGAPVLEIETGADGRNMNSFHAEMNFTAPVALTPWGNVTNLWLDAACARLAEPGAVPFVQVHATADGVNSRWGSGNQVAVSTSFLRDADSNLVVQTQLNSTRCAAYGPLLETNHYEAQRIVWKGSTTLGFSNATPISVEGNLHASDLRTPWGIAHEITVDCHADRSFDTPLVTAGWGFWSKLAPWNLECRVDLRRISIPRLRVERLAFGASWNAPRLKIQNLQSDVNRGEVNADATLDIITRELKANLAAAVNPSFVSSLSHASVGQFLDQFEWTAIPSGTGKIRLVLPEWTNRPPSWRSNMANSFTMQADPSVAAAVFRKIPVNSSSAHVLYTNRTWFITGIHVTRPDGVLDLDYTASQEGFRYVIDSKMDLNAARPLLPPGRRSLLDDLIFSVPPKLHADISGCWHDASCFRFSATASGHDFVVRGETVSGISAAIDCTNRLLTVRNLEVSNNECNVKAPWVQINLSNKVGKVTNATGNLSASLLKHLLRKNPPDFLNVVRFDSPPTVEASGTFNLTNQDLGDMHFHVSGDGIHYTNLLADHISGNVNWVGKSVYLTNINAKLYHNGSMTGWIRFVARPTKGSDFAVNVNLSDIDLAALINGITEKTNRVQGQLDGAMFLQGPNSSDRSHWNGRGFIHIHNALLWDIKLFGLLSPVLNIITPGWGHSTAREASCVFVVTNNGVTSDDLELRFTGFRLVARGTVDMNKHMNAKIEADPVFMTKAFTPLSKLFEYHLAGTLKEPIMEPVFVPKFVMLMLHPLFHPFHTLKNLAMPNHNDALAPPSATLDGK